MSLCVCVGMYMCMYMCMYLFMHVYVHVFVHACECIQIHSRILGDTPVEHKVHRSPSVSKNREGTKECSGFREHLCDRHLHRSAQHIETHRSLHVHLGKGRRT